jgi:hypothetical protein
MKRLASIAAVLLLTSTGCENAKSKLDGAQGLPSNTAGVSSVADHSGDMETRVRRLEDNYAKNAEALDFLGKVYAQQKQQQQQQAREEADPNAVFAVDIDQNIKAGLVEGKNDAFVTIIEAWDFA